MAGLSSRWSRYNNQKTKGKSNMFNKSNKTAANLIDFLGRVAYFIFTGQPETFSGTFAGAPAKGVAV